MHIQFIATFFYKFPQKTLNVFRDLRSGEVLFIARELAHVMGYRSLGTLLRKNPLFSAIHHKMLIGTEIRAFKRYLQNVCIERYTVSTKILFITESGFYLLMACDSKKYAYYPGEWICQTVIPHAKNTTQSSYVTHWKSETFCCEFPLIQMNNRIGFFVHPLTKHLQNFHHIDMGYGRYIENIHLQNIEFSIRDSGNLIFYESGLYRYLVGTNHSLGKRFATEYMQKLVPQLRHSQLEWQKITQNNKPPRVKVSPPPEKFYHQIEEQFGEWQQQFQQSVIRDSVVMNARLDGFLKFFRDLIPLLEERFSHLQHGIEEIKTALSQNSDPVISIVKWKKLALQLQVFHIDKQTPHTLFVKALTKYVKSYDYQVLRRVIDRKTMGREGENWIQLGTYTYHIWLKK
ncbi:hypothetical protein [Candidatus Uabimicrobium amorphum]|uniref:Bro-N domain-containing protein n=1 Tax=Uabimicrobium amorphum TaxID=2596890 RepID=A0A5S9IMI7_UABAM|nr:hypothetical protein [Candidatus Uabimicrobium amorphum]BBM84648.1 hypothetical protein UABAM_03009 [Candidatus Uabimicrobium amorphum]